MKYRKKDALITELRLELEILKKKNEQHKEIENIEFDFELPFNVPPEKERSHDSISDENVFFNAWLLTERQRGLLHKGVKDMKDGSVYEGELDWYENACGEGMLQRQDGAVVKGTWFNDLQHGLCVESYKHG